MQLVFPGLVDDCDSIANIPDTLQLYREMCEKSVKRLKDIDLSNQLY